MTTAVLLMLLVVLGIALYAQFNGTLNGALNAFMGAGDQSSKGNASTSQ